MSKDNPNKKTIDIVRMMAKQWAVLEDAKKHQWDQQYQADKQAYIEDCIKYDSKLTEEQRNDIYEAKERRNDQKEKLALRKVRIGRYINASVTELLSYILENPRAQQTQKTCFWILTLHERCDLQQGQGDIQRIPAASC